MVVAAVGGASGDGVRAGGVWSLAVRQAGRWVGGWASAKGECGLLDRNPADPEAHVGGVALPYIYIHIDYSLGVICPATWERPRLAGHWRAMEWTAASGSGAEVGSKGWEGRKNSVQCWLL